MAKVLAESGAKLVLHYCKNEQGIQKTMATVEEIGAAVEVLQCDFRALETVQPFFQRAWEVFGGLDALVNNAGIVTKSLALKDLDGQKFQETIAVNLTAPYLLSTAFAQHCIDAKQPGAIVNNSSIHAQATCEWFSAYAASKAGMDAMTKAQAVEWGQNGIRVNVLAPGVVPVERTEAILNQPQMQEKWLKTMPMHRYGTPEEMGYATAYLLSDQAQWMTGSVLTLDGGLIARGNYPARD
jgi:glucose 1-dehydrogenase